MLRSGAIFAFLASLAIAQTEFVIEDEQQPTMQEGSNVQMFRFKHPDSYYMATMPSPPWPYMARFYNSPQMATMTPMMMMMPGQGMMGPMLEQFFRTYLKWMTPAQKNEIRQMRQMGATREMMIRRVQDFYEGMPAMSERRVMATMLMKDACHKISEMVFGRSQAMNLKRAIEYAASSARPFTSAQEVQEMFEDMNSQVEDYQKQRMIGMYGPLCQRVAHTYMVKMYGGRNMNSATMKRSMMMDTTGSSSMMMSSSQQQQQQQPMMANFQNYYQNPYASSIYNTIQTMPFQSTGKYFFNRFWPQRSSSMFYNNPMMTPSSEQMMSETTATNNNMMEQQQQGQQQQQMSNSGMMGSSSTEEQQQQQQEMMSSEQQQKMMGMTGGDMMMTGSPASTKQMQQQQTSQQQQQQQQQQQMMQQSRQRMFQPEIYSNNNEMFW